MADGSAGWLMGSVVVVKMIPQIFFCLRGENSLGEGDGYFFKKDLARGSVKGVFCRIKVAMRLADIYSIFLVFSIQKNVTTRRVGSSWGSSGHFQPCMILL